MERQTKIELLDYLKAHNDGSDTAKVLIKRMERECYYADADVFSVCVDDLNERFGEPGTYTDMLRRKLGKADGEEYNISDCERVADAISDLIAEEFTENLYNAIEYEL